MERLSSVPSSQDWKGDSSGKKDGVRRPNPLGASPFLYNKAEVAGLMSGWAESLRRPRATRQQTGGDGEPRSDGRPASGTSEGYDHFHAQCSKPVLRRQGSLG